MSASVLVIGEGLMADFVCKALTERYVVTCQPAITEQVQQAPKLALVLHDSWHPDIHQRAEKVFRQYGIPWLRCFVSFGQGIIGPLVLPEKPGCSQCADIRRLMAGSDRKEMLELQHRLALRQVASRDACASRNGFLQMAYVIGAEVDRIVQGGESQLEGSMVLMHLKTLKISRHAFLPNPHCPVCGMLPDDEPSIAKISLAPCPKTSVDEFRTRQLEDYKDGIIHDYLDYQTGLLNGKMADLISPFASVTVNLPLFHGDEASAGRTHSYAHSELTAIFEGLERYCGLAPHGKNTTIRDSYRNIAAIAFNPLDVGVHAPEAYAKPDFPFKPFHPDRVIDWVWGYSFLNQRPILVPELLAYYSLGCSDGGFVYETSNGCALGGSITEAILYGILEVVERDAFLMTWYAKLPLFRLDLRTVKDKELQLMIHRFQMVGAYDLNLFNATMENGVPSVWALAKNRRKTGVHLICAAGSHINLARAAKGAIHELAGLVGALDGKFLANRRTYEQMYANPSLVRHMEDHSMLYGLPQAEERFDFLLDDKRPLKSFDEELENSVKHMDLTDDLKDILQVFHRLNLDVIVVNQTSPELKRNGLYCVKVLIPGMLPMTFGYHLTRLEGLQRVLEVPYKLGYVAKPLTGSQLNPHPHPFP